MEDKEKLDVIMARLDDVMPNYVTYERKVRGEKRGGRDGCSRCRCSRCRASSRLRCRRWCRRCTVKIGLLGVVVGVNNNMTPTKLRGKTEKARC